MKLRLRLLALAILVVASPSFAQVLGGPVINGGSSGINLTTSGSSGAATYTGGVLNIPIYSNGSSGVTSFTGDGGLYSNSASTGAVTATLSGAIAYSLWGNPS